MKRIKTFPKTITAKIEHDSDCDYLVAEPGADMAAHAEVGLTVKVGVYKLVAVHDVKLTVVSTPSSKPQGA